MTWLAEQTKNRPDDAAKEKLLAERAQIITAIEALKATPLRSKTQAAAAGRIEDLTALAKKVTSIDKKLGRL
jgi:hypothetical protein